MNEKEHTRNEEHSKEHTYLELEAEHVRKRFEREAFGALLVAIARGTHDLVIGIQRFFSREPATGDLAFREARSNTTVERKRKRRGRIPSKIK